MTQSEALDATTIGAVLGLVGGLLVVASSGLPAVGVRIDALDSPAVVLLGGGLLLIGGVFLASTLR